MADTHSTGLAAVSDRNSAAAQHTGLGCNGGTSGWQHTS